MSRGRRIVIIGAVAAVAFAGIAGALAMTAGGDDNACAESPPSAGAAGSVATIDVERTADRFEFTVTPTFEGQLWSSSIRLERWDGETWRPKWVIPGVFSGRAEPHAVRTEGLVTRTLEGNSATAGAFELPPDAAPGWWRLALDVNAPSGAEPGVVETYALLADECVGGGASGGGTT